MEKNKLLLLTSISLLCAVTGTTFFASHELNNKIVFANQEAQVANPYVMNITNFTQYEASQWHFVAKTATGYDIYFSTNYEGFSPIEASGITILAGGMVYNNVEYHGHNLNNAISRMISLTVTFNEGGQLHLNSYNVPDYKDYYPYTDPLNVTSGVPINFLSWYDAERDILPNAIEIEADKDTTITSIRIEYLCHD